MPLAGRLLRRSGRLGPQRADRPERKPGDSGSVKTETAPLKVDMRTRAQKYTFSSVIALLRNGSACLRKARFDG